MRGASINWFVYVFGLSKSLGLKRTEDMLSKQLIKNHTARFGELMTNTFNLRKNIHVRLLFRNFSDRMNCCIK
jgi:hypothetical protein